MRGWRGVAIGASGILVFWGAVAAVLVFAVGGSGSERNEVVVSEAGCGLGWRAPRSGSVTFTVKNTSAATAFNVQLLSDDQKLLYAKTNVVGPSTEVAMPVVLPPGSYLFRCQGSNGFTETSPSEQVRGSAVSGAHPVAVVWSDQVQFALYDYEASLLTWMKRLGVDTDRLTAAVHAGRLEEARRLWLPAHLDYSRLGVAYDTFGKFNDEINERPLGLPGGVDDPNFEGFLRLEYGLWHDQPRAELVPVADKLDRAVHGLLRQFPSMKMLSGDLTLRAHEILENTLQFELTGETDEGSHTNLATAWANVQGTKLAIAALTPALGHVDPGLLGEVTTGLNQLSATLLSQHAAGGWTPLGSLSTRDRETIDSSLSGLLEKLELVPDTLEPAMNGGDD